LKNLKRGENFGDIEVDERMILKWIVKSRVGSAWIELAGDRFQ
jgi:hypothetical protein